MQTLVAFAVIVFLLGLYFGLPYQQACKRRLALMEQDKVKPAEKKSGHPTFDKPLSSS